MCETLKYRQMTSRYKAKVDGLFSPSYTLELCLPPIHSPVQGRFELNLIFYNDFALERPEADLSGCAGFITQPFGLLDRQKKRGGPVMNTGGPFLA
jgi:hypothetical protein